ncbi:MAG TPA: T9SS type A sorting domain-containing protein [Bacteroidales bacterium]|nr:T9SS type A sorting domain-containing protein [Bacteroidales bacterium]
MKRFLFFLLISSQPVISQSQNLVINPGLELWTSSTKPTSWTVAEGCSAESTVIKSGTFSCIQNAGPNGSRNLGQNISVTAGKDYSLSLYYITGANTTGNGGRVWCKWLNSNNAEVSDPASEEQIQSGFLKSDSWKQYSVSVKAPESAVTFFLQVRSLPNSITYWDDFVFEETIATGTDNDYSPEIILYPVPVENQLYLKNSGEKSTAEIIDLTGTVIKTEKTTGDLTIIQTGELVPGIYFIRIRTGNKIVIKRFAKN